MNTSTILCRMLSGKRVLICSKRLVNKSLVHFSSATDPASIERLQSFRTTETNPINHTSDHLGQYYTVAKEGKNHLFKHGGFTKAFEAQIKTFNEVCFMVRKPAVDVINCMNNLDYTKPAVRFVLYGKLGAGKTTSLAHLIHYAYKKGFVILHLPWLYPWMKTPKEHSNSESREGFIEQNLEVSQFLVHFKTQNAHLLSNFKTTEEHIWNKREKTPKDATLVELVDHGINRIKYASEVLIALCKELKSLSNRGDCKTLVAIDGFNGFFYPHTKIYAPGKIPIPPNRITATEAFLNVTKFDWKNAVIIVTADEMLMNEEDQKSYLPRYLLGKEGFEHLDPFVPIAVDAYTDKELKSCMDYYRERKWITPYENQDNEVSFSSGNNPQRVMEISYGL